MAGLATVLIIDDDRDYTAAVTALLEGHGYAVRAAPNGREGVALARTLRPALVLLDVMMTERTEGFFVLQSLRAIPALAATPVIVASAVYGEEPGFRVSPAAGWLPADLFLPKPVDPARLLTEVDRLTGRAAGGAP